MAELRLTNRMNKLGDRASEKVVHARLEKLDRDNDRLRTQVDVLREDLHEERSALKEALGALKKHEQPITVKTSRRPHLLRSVVIAGVAYVLGTRDGRERTSRSVSGPSPWSTTPVPVCRRADDPWSTTPNGAEAPTWLRTRRSPIRVELIEVGLQGGDIAARRRPHSRAACVRAEPPGSLGP